MSYILDALRKADAQRERDASRGIHAQAASLGTTAGAAGPRRRLRSLGAIAASVVIAGFAAWFFLRETRTPPTQVAAVAQPPATGGATAAATAPAVRPSPATAISPPPPAPVSPPAAAARAPVPDPVQAREAAFSAQAAPSAGAASAASASAASASASPTAPVTGGLPPDAPRIAISGGVYSPNPLQRMLIVNGQVFNEGSEVAPGVKVEAIQPRTAILGFRGARYTVAY